jgi:hypothetical protein
MIQQRARGAERSARVHSTCAKSALQEIRKILEAFGAAAWENTTLILTAGKIDCLRIAECARLL